MSCSLTILGCGPSGGVPRIGPMWGKCDPENPKNRRRRCAVLVQKYSKNGVTRVLVDTPPDLRDQLIDLRVSELDGVFYTHDHADHTHGIDDLRPVCFSTGRRIPVYGDVATLKSLKSRFRYCFSTKAGSGYSPILRDFKIGSGQTTIVEGAGGSISILAVHQEHGPAASLGFRIGSIGYSPDVSDLSDMSAQMFEGLDVWIVDALRHAPHPSHFHVKKALKWIERLAPKRAVLTHMTHDLDYDALVRDLPEHIEPAFDGMVIDFDA